MYLVLCCVALFLSFCCDTLSEFLSRVLSAREEQYATIDDRRTILGRGSLQRFDMGTTSRRAMTRQHHV